MQDQQRLDPTSTADNNNSANSEAAGTEAPRHRGTEAAGTEAAGTEAAGTEAAGTTSAPRLLLRQAPVSKKLKLNDQVNKAETVLVLKGVESQWPYASYNNLGECLKKADPNSEVFAKLALKRSKAAYIVSHGLGPHFKSKIVKSVKKSQGFVVCSDSASFKQLGLSKHVDIVICWWSEETQEVRSEFFDYHSVGHEPAERQVQDIKESLESVGLSLGMLVGFSRDSPTVMQAVERKLVAEAESEGSPLVVSMPCYLHPTHTAFQKAVEKLDVDVTSFLVKLHTFFKLSTARREDRNLVQEQLAADLGEAFTEVIDRFFMRHVSTRWLELQEVVMRVLELWESTKQYFMVFLPKSKVQCNKNAVKTDGYKEIAAFLHPDVEKLNKARLEWVAGQANLSRPFLLRLQGRDPLIHELYDQCGQLFIM